MKNRTAYTLIELLLAVAVIAPLLGLILLGTVKMAKPLPAFRPLDIFHGFDGVGILLVRDDESQSLQIAKVFPNSPAAAAKLSAGLVIQAVDGVPTRGKSISDCQILIHGKTGTSVRLELVNVQRHTTNIVELTRQKLTR